MHHALSLSGHTLHALPSGALYWPAQNLLCVSDLHFGKSARMARRGGALLPPYEVEETLTRLDADIAATGPELVICLGDSFDDDTATTELSEPHTLWLLRLMAGRRWVWIAGNHDPAPATLPGAHLTEVQIAPLTFRHIADPAQTGEISGHYHPKARLAGRSRPCFLADPARIILPAYGTFTGGLWCDDPAFEPLIETAGLAILTGPKCLPIPLKAVR
jgi:DNA ligase-associated metallophosphoesterase